MRKSVYVSCPNTGKIHKHVVFALLHLQRDQRFNIHFSLPTHVPYENNLSRIRLAVLEGQFHYWLNIDSDNPPRMPGGNPLDNIAGDVEFDIIGYPTPVWHNTGDGAPVYFNAMDAVYGEGGELAGWKQHVPQVGLQQVDAVGSGCILVRREVLERVDFQPFHRVWNSDGVATYGGDYSFCERARSLGFKVWADFTRPCMHFNELEITEVMAAFSRIMDERLQAGDV